MSKSYAAYLAGWKERNPNIVQPEFISKCPDLTGAKSFGGSRVWDNTSNCCELADGRALEVGKTTSWTDCYAVFPSRNDWSNYSKPLSSNEFYG